MPSAPTVRAYAMHWLDRRAAAGVPRVRLGALHASLERFVLPLVGDVPLGALTSQHVATVQTALLSGRRGVGSAKTALHGTLGGLVRAARHEGLIDRNPLAGLRWPAHARPEPDPFIADEAEAILEHYRRHREYAPRVLVPLVLLAGLRPTEAAALAWRDLWWRAGVCRIRGAVVAGDRTAGKSDNAPRRIALAPRLLALLREATRGRQRTGPVVASRRGRPVATPKCGREGFADTLRALDIRPRAFFHLRHTFIVRSLERGSPAGTVAAYVGMRPDYLVGVYGHWLPSTSPHPPKSHPASPSWQTSSGTFEREDRP